jgi:ferric-dicitrate binding protein FerR (iron transport regulator)
VERRSRRGLRKRRVFVRLPLRRRRPDRGSGPSPCLQGMSEIFHDRESAPSPEDAVARFEAALTTWSAGAREPIDVEAALSRVRVRRGAEVTLQGAPDDLAIRRAQKAAAPTLWQRYGFRAAATLTAILSAGMIWRMMQPVPASRFYVTTTGTTQNIRLADGTDVRLGPSSSLRVSPDYGTVARAVELRGEAWFAVTHNEKMPFSIRMGSTTVEDLGTSFLVRETDAHDVSVRVTEGVVRLRRTVTAGDSVATLKAGDAAVAAAAGITVASASVSVSEREALTQGRLVFSDASLEEVRDALHRWYGVSLSVTDSAMLTRHLTADFTGEPIARVADVLGLSLGLSATQNGMRIELSPLTRASAPK